MDREDERRRLDRLLEGGGGLAVIYGRRRLGKTRLLVDWARQANGVYTVADQSAAELQRRYFAEAVSERLPGFADVQYADWRLLLRRLAREASAAGFRGPIVFDELPYLVATSPELPSVLQQWLDHEAKAAGLACAIAGSSQRMMQGMVLDAEAPLYGRAKELIELGPLPVRCIQSAFGARSPVAAAEAFAAWGGVPRYWELALDIPGTTLDRLDALVLDPRGPLHREPDRLLMEELPPALEVRPVLDAIGAGAHRMSEIAARIGRPATSLSRPLERLLGLGLAIREVPFGESERGGKRSLYRIEDPFFRLWFRVVAPHRAKLVASERPSRLELLERHWPGLMASAWEDLARAHVSRAGKESASLPDAPWGPAQRWWHGAAPEWDLASESIHGGRVLLGEVKWKSQPFKQGELRAIASEVFSRPPPPAVVRAKQRLTRCLFVPRVAPGTPKVIDGVHIVTGREVMGMGLSMRRESGARAGRSTSQQ